MAFFTPGAMSALKERGFHFVVWNPRDYSAAIRSAQATGYGPRRNYSLNGFEMSISLILWPSCMSSDASTAAPDFNAVEMIKLSYH